MFDDKLLHFRLDWKKKGFYHFITPNSVFIKRNNFKGFWSFKRLPHGVKGGGLKLLSDLWNIQDDLNICIDLYTDSTKLVSYYRKAGFVVCCKTSYKPSRIFMMRQSRTIKNGQRLN